MVILQNFRERKRKRRELSAATETNLEDPSTDGVGDALGVLPLLLGDDGEIGDYGL